MSLKQKWKKWKDNQEKEAWDKKLESYAQNKFGMQGKETPKGLGKSFMPTSFIRRDANFRKENLGQKVGMRLRGRGILVKKIFGHLITKEETFTLVLDRGMLLCERVDETTAATSEEAVSENQTKEYALQLVLAGSTLKAVGNRSFELQKREYCANNAVKYDKHVFKVPSPEERSQWMVTFSKVPGLERRVEDYFEVGLLLGKGGTALVRECIGRFTGNRYALKSGITLNSEATESLHNELRILQMCVKDRHPSIPTLHDFFYDAQGNLFLVTELLSGGELLTKIIENDHFTERAAIKVVIKILEGVKYLHAKGIAHRDLKPENLVFVSEAEDSQLKIIDFDLAKYLYGGVAATPCGTSHYMAPEVVSETTHSLSVDMWSVGCIVFILLCGRYPFWAENRAEREARILHCTFEFKPELWDQVSDDAKDFVCALLKTNPKERLTAEGALQHHWLRTKHTHTSKIDTELKTVGNIRSAMSSSEFSAFLDVDGCPKSSFSKRISSQMREGRQVLFSSSSKNSMSDHGEERHARFMDTAASGSQDKGAGKSRLSVNPGNLELSNLDSSDLRNVSKAPYSPGGLGPTGELPSPSMQEEVGSSVKNENNFGPPVLKTLQEAAEVSRRFTEIIDGPVNVVIEDFK
eukprot:CAMPEP_0196587616 /NCGR_PEP_ID=MMETSP1081-20130531/58061_1 /TAXON_ID=36882 /ORGANISM="Pyramimonas amylifera, Strain CCMP720" /LENGTH=637 /DNA_ID=CAMNT_0041909851 /DNA_START=59 /DNA_END=1972 /DNA_ORIENTATION=+